MNPTVGFIGTGNMGGALARAVCQSLPPQQVVLANRTPEKAQKLAAELGCCFGSNQDAALCDYIFLGVKPQMMAGMLSEIRSTLSTRTAPFILVSMAAALTCAQIQEMAGMACPVIRIMPNTPVAIGQGVVQVCSLDTRQEDVDTFLSMIAHAGLVDLIPEPLMDAASAVSGCGPAFAFLFLEALADGGVACGLPRDKALSYAAQMLSGSANLVLQSGQHPGALKDAVCSPGGTTIQGVRTLEEHGFRAAAMDAVIAAYQKTRTLGK